MHPAEPFTPRDARDSRRPPPAATQVEVLRLRASLQPADPAFTYLQDGEVEAGSLTYGELEAQARAIAGLLRQAGLQGERALLLYPPGLAFVAAFYGCLFGAVVAVPLQLPAGAAGWQAGLAGLRAFAADARPAAILTTAAALPGLSGALGSLAELSGIPLLATDHPAPDLTGGWRDERLDGAELAFLQYTSGSTSRPKGVMVSHDQLIHNARMLQAALGVAPHMVAVSWLPHYHDMGLLAMILQTVYRGGRCCLMSPQDFLARPLRWLEAISCYRATSSAAPNFAYELCARKITPEQWAGLDLSSWVEALNAAEPVRLTTLERFTTVFGPAGFRPEALLPCYGLAEATVYGTGAAARPRAALRLDQAALQHRAVVPAADRDQGARVVVSCGPRHAAGGVAIVDPDTLCRCPAGQVGEIWLTGPNVAAGYWQQADATARTFQARLADSGEGPFLRTGDLGFLHQGELYVTGRLKDVIIIAGQNYDAHDIEQTVEDSDPRLRRGCCAAFAVDGEAGEHLVVVAETVDGISQEAAGDAARSIGQAVAGRHGLTPHAVVLVPPRTLAKTTSGKLRRQEYRRAYDEDSLPVLLRWRPGDGGLAGEGSDLETRLARVWAEVLGRSSIHLNDDFFELGGTSLQVLQLLDQVERLTGQGLSSSSLYQARTIRRQADLLRGAAEAQAPAARPSALARVVAAWRGRRSPAGS